MHWTYEKYDPESDLRQGDILEPTSSLFDLFKEVHPHFTQTKYRGYFILTQSCDMVRREISSNSCNSTHIVLSVIRSLQDIISISLKDRFGFLAPGIYAQNMEKSVSQLAERLINQNENSLGLFYLHADFDAGISVHSAAVLRVAISVKATEHYEKLMNARIGRLSTEFQPKLGWMVGNLYSRVGVTDWKEKASDRSQSDEEYVINKILSFSRNEPVWIDRSIYKKILKAYPGFDRLSVMDQDKIIKDFLPTPPKEKMIEIIVKTVNNVAPKTTEETIDKIKSRLINDPQFEAQIRKLSRLL